MKILLVLDERRLSTDSGRVITGASLFGSISKFEAAVRSESEFSALWRTSLWQVFVDRFVRLLIAFRKAHRTLSRSRFWRDDVRRYGCGPHVDMSPESLVIGSSLLHANISLSLIAGLFLSNFPEALSSSVGMRQQGMAFGRILWMWTSLMVITGIGAALGNLFFEGAPPALFSFFEGLAAGAMLTMIAETMLPEAFLKGGSIVGFSTLLGFLTAISFKSLEPQEASHGPSGIAPPAVERTMEAADSSSDLHRFFASGG